MLIKNFIIFILLLIYNSVKQRTSKNVEKKESRKLSISKGISVKGDLKWESPIHYHIATPSHKEMIEKVIKYLELKTCLTFRKHAFPFDNRNGLFYTLREKNNHAELGKIKNNEPQRIKLTSLCYSRFGCVMKYTLLSLGLTPPILRSDRNQYVKVNLKNVDKKNQSYFDNSGKEKHLILYDLPYDYTSIVHPGEYYCSKNGKKTIEGKQKYYDQMIGQEEYPSFQDIQTINKFYCSKNCTNKENYCQNGGYLNPNNCTSCICPTGFVGYNCAELIKQNQSCLVQERDHFITGSGGRILGGNFTCIFHFKTHKDFRIKLIINYLDMKSAGPCSERNGVQIRYKKDKSKTGIVLCNKKYINVTHPLKLMSEDNSLLLFIHFTQPRDYLQYTIETISKEIVTTKKPKTTKGITTTKRKTSTSTKKLKPTKKVIPTKKRTSRTTAKLNKKISTNMTTKTSKKTTMIDKKG
uniref:Metalloendopeptidase n=1 Tax=Parastrongyloides trichosuri TaxID=131310 RepID=A0A0N4ZDX5_PARTI